MNKKCIFCGNDTKDSKSVEHIIPESLGNTEYVLEKGFVCDKCNNYFSRKVEKPFMDIESIKRIRFHYNVKSKKGNVPSTNCMIGGHIGKMDYINGSIFIGLDEDAIKDIFAKQPKYLFTIAEDIEGFKNSYVVARFLAKIVYEFVIYFFYSKNKNSIGNEDFEFCFSKDSNWLNKIRNYAKCGNSNKKVWPYKVNLIDKNDDKYLRIESETVGKNIYFVLYLSNLKFSFKLSLD